MHSAGVATALLESGMVEMPKEGGQITFGLEAPAGLIQITAECSADGKAGNITLRNAASFVEALDLSIDVPEIGSVKLDIAYGHNLRIHFTGCGHALGPQDSELDKCCTVIK